MATTLSARSKPYRPAVKWGEHICTRCGILFRTNNGKNRRPLTECRDCRHAP